MNPTARIWCRIALFNLLLVTMAGVMLRLKILLPIPWLNHKYMLHAHSHFAFSGWVGLFLMAALTGLLEEKIAGKYSRCLFAFNLSSYGMLLSFPFVGYAPASIFFSVMNVLVSWWFAVKLWRDLTVMPVNAVRTAARWALFFLVFSAIGTFSLAWLMATKVQNQPLYFGAIYFYLHFQYNGWFLFSIMALLMSRLPEAARLQATTPVRMLGVITIPAYLLSALWMNLPDWVRLVAGVSAAGQLIFFLLWIRPVYLYWSACTLQGLVQTIWRLSLAALAVKVLLQTLSVIPALGKYAFAYRPVVVGYLHLVLLGFVSMFLIGYLVDRGLLPSPGARLRLPTGLFITGVLLTVTSLLVQGLFSIFAVFLPFVNEVLLLAALLLLVAVAWLNRSTRQSLVLRPRAL